MRSFTKLQVYGPDSYTYWVSGIYKIVSYDRGRYHAYFIRDFDLNWGCHVCNPPGPNTCWPTLNSAKRDCRKHAETYTPARKTVIRAEAILKGFQIKHREHAA